MHSLCFQHEPLSGAHPAGELPLCEEIFQNPGKVDNQHLAAVILRRFKAEPFVRCLSVGMLRAQLAEDDHLLTLH